MVRSFRSKRAGGSFRIRVGGTSDVVRASLVIGLADREGVAAASLEASCNGRLLGSATEVADLTALAGVKRALRFTIDPQTLLPGENVVGVRQTDAAGAQQIVWVELRINER